MKNLVTKLRVKLVRDSRLHVTEATIKQANEEREIAAGAIETLMRQVNYYKAKVRKNAP